MRNRYILIVLFTVLVALLDQFTKILIKAAMPKPSPEPIANPSPRMAPRLSGGSSFSTSVV